MTQDFGYKRVTDTGSLLRYRMMASPTGRQLVSDGSLVLGLLNFDPNTALANATQIYPDGAVGIYVRAGVQEQWAFTRATGWQQL